MARLARIHPELLYPVKHRSAQAQADLAVIRARAGLVRARTGLVNTARGLAKSYGEPWRGCNVRNLDPEKAEGLSPELQRALEPLLSAIAELSQRICQYNERVEALAQRATKADYPWNQAFVRYVWLAGMRPGKLFQDRCGIRSHKLLC